MFALSGPHFIVNTWYTEVVLNVNYYYYSGI